MDDVIGQQRNDVLSSYNRNNYYINANFKNTIAY